MSIDRVFVHGIRGEALVGLLDWERREKQPLEVDVEVTLDTTRLLMDQRLVHGVDFVKLIDIVKRRLNRGHVGLVEVLADRIAADVLEQTVGVAVRVTVRKFRACESDAAHVGVTVERSLTGATRTSRPDGRS